MKLVRTKQKKAKINKKGKNGGGGKGQNGGGGKGQNGGVGKGKKGSKGKGKLTKEEKQRLKAGKRNDDSDSEFSYRSVVSAGGTRHVRRRRKRADGTYSDSDSYHSSQDEDGEERRRQRRKERGELESDTVDSSNPNTSNGSKDHYHDGDSDYSYASEVSEGGTRYEVKRKRLRDEEGNIIGYGEKEAAGDNLSDTESVKTRRGSMDGSFVKDRINVEDVLGPQLIEHNENNRLKDGVDWPEKSLDRIPSEFSDASTDDDDVDLSKMTEEEKEEYFKNKEERRKEREARRRAKYGDKYDEIMKKKLEKKEREKKEQEQEQSNEEKEKRDQKEKDEKTSGRKSSLRKFSDSLGKGKEPAKSMVTYEKGPPREIGGKETFDSREHGLPHDSWGKKDKTDMSLRRGSSDSSDFVPTKLRRETTMLKKLPTIPQGKVAEVTKKKKPGMEDRESSQYEGDDDDDSLKRTNRGDEEKSKWDSVVEMGADGKLRLKKKLIDLKDLDDETLRRLGIDPTLTAKEIAKKLKALFGNDIRFKEGSFFIGTKHADDFGDMDDDELAKQEDLDITTLNGQRRINILMKRGGSALRRHMLRIIAECRLHENAYKCANIDEQGSIDFLAHYRLVDPKKVDGYAKAFVVEDTNFDTFIDYKNTKSALDGIESIQHMTPKQMEYVFRVLNIDEATRVTFRMFAVLTALCERVSTMDDLSRQLLEICNLLDIERKLDLYKAMFYTNVPTYRDSNYVTEESLKIELMAGGLNWSQQEYVMEKMEPNTFGEISFLDYMCYIPLFLSMHDNICDNPLDMSNQKYQMPPRRRPPSVQRDMNPLSQPLSKQSAFLLRKQAVDFEEGTANPDHYTKEYVQRVNKYAQLPDIPHILQRQSSNVSTTSEYLSGSSFYREKSRVY
ncbi:zinc finger CCCH domain-containing protein 13-like [Mytilus californianus]|uniref:zinc finger CCCH domain-containing protein 13-like n=1 Tax=Mytilus californianus TaxID=6549 RepID=UPI0022452BCA|nr:zinc finger CCCH domain-containing protein 13-like [Mytilus californianus]